MEFVGQIERELPGMRAHAVSLMRDRLRVERPTGRTVRVDGKTVPEMETVWIGRGKVQSNMAYPSQPEVGGGTVTLAVFEVHIPVDAPVTILVDDVFVVESSQDEMLVGTRLRARVDPSKTWRTARRYNCQEVVA